MDGFVTRYKESKNERELSRFYLADSFEAWYLICLKKRCREGKGSGGVGKIRREEWLSREINGTEDDLNRKSCSKAICQGTREFDVSSLDELV